MLANKPQPNYGRLLGVQRFPPKKCYTIFSENETSTK
jgi:hypothetical protein